MDKLLNRMIRERCGVKVIITKIEKALLRRFGLVERMTER